MSQSTDQHRESAKDCPVTCAVLTVSDSRTEATDKSGQLIINLLKEAGYVPGDYAIVKDDPPQIEAQLRGWIAKADIDAICITGGTGIGPRDTTVEVVGRLIDQELEGFGELFRMLSYEQIGPAAMLSRAVAGLTNQTLIFSMPGSSAAVELAMSKLIVPELSHLVWQQRG